MTSRNKRAAAFKAAFPYTLPIFAGFTFLGIAYGVYMRVCGFSAIYPILMSMTIFAGSMEFIAVDLLLGTFNPLGAMALALMVNARHIFYGISMLDKYQGVGWKKAYLIFGMCDESFSINCTTEIPEGVDKGWFYFFVTLLNHFYWVFGATMGGIFGSVVQIEAKGLDFVMTALIVVIFLNSWIKEKNHTSSCIGLGAAFLCLLAFKSKSFMIPSMLLILAALTLLRNRLEEKVS